MKIQVGDQVFHTPEKLSHVHDGRYDASMLKPSRVVGAVIPAEQTISDRDCTKFSEEDLAQMRELVAGQDSNIITGTALVTIPRLDSGVALTSGLGIEFVEGNRISVFNEVTQRLEITKEYREQYFNKGVAQLRQGILDAATKLKPETKVELKALLDQVDTKFEE